MADPRRPPTALIGTGRLARAFLPGLRAAGYPIVAVASRRRSSARSAARGLTPCRVTTDPVRAVASARLVLLAVPDAAIAAVAGRLAAAPDLVWSGRTVLHHAGALGLEPLEPLRRHGASVGLLHPLQCLGRAAISSELLAGSRARIAGRGGALGVARRLARDLGLTPLPLSSGMSRADRAAYHAAAALVSNDLLALFSYAVDLFEGLGMSRGAAVAALAPLASGTLTQTAETGPGGALTGPVVRGDLDTVRLHMSRLARASRGAAEVHRLLSLRLLDVAHAEGRPVPRGMRSALRRAGGGKRSGV